MFNPISTYRIQFNKAFSFEDFEQVIPYLQKLGVNTIYASPIFKSTPASLHGYDIVNPHIINPEIGSMDEFEKISNELKKHGMAWLQDIVPNHMAFHPHNEWLMDVLEKGPQSAFDLFFDIGPSDESFRGRLMVPFLGTPLTEVIENDELSIVYDQQRFQFRYYDDQWPLHIRSYPLILLSGEEYTDAALTQWLRQVELLQKVEDPTAYTLELNELKLQLASLLKQPATKEWLKACLKQVNQNKALIRQLADGQEYRLCAWHETDQQINFRRFFTINGLVCLMMQHPQVFDHYHRFIQLLLKKEMFQGLRVDHIDGLYDPSAYLDQLRKLSGEKTYLVVEKILEHGEELAENWPVQGNTGYDFLSLVNNLFTLQHNETSFTRFYDRIKKDSRSLHQQVLDKKRYILYQHMGGELENLCTLWLQLGLVDEKVLSLLPREDLKNSIGEFLVHCPVYRFYGNAFPLAPEEAGALQEVFAEMRTSSKGLRPAIDILEEVLLQKAQQENIAYADRALHFYQRCMQFTGPLMAKGVEDTLMYVYSRFIGHNEVGDSPGSFGISMDEFHQQMIDRQQKWPLSMNASATHDTKRGEDVRARLTVLTDMGAEWFAAVSEWQALNHELKKEGFPDANEEYFIYQTLIGFYPMPGEKDIDVENRLHEYLQKAFREAKQHSSWSAPNEAFEESIRQFSSGLLDKSRPFWRRFEELHLRVADFGILNSLAQVLLKFTCPGVPDTYQGCECWDLSLVDPDNRRPVHYKQREQWLDELQAYTGENRQLVFDLWQSRYTGKLKLWLVHTLLKERKRQPDLFARGDYVPLQVVGSYREHVFAFARKWEKTWVIVAVSLHLFSIGKDQEKEGNEIDWRDTRIVIPSEAPLHYENILLKTHETREDSIELNSLFTPLPLAFLKLEETARERTAGILMPIASLPSPFGIGDFGPEAYAFADFLSSTCQRYWQVLPLNPTNISTGHSPYSSSSSMAGNTLLISPEWLHQEGYLDSDSLQEYNFPSTNRIAYKDAERVKDIFHERAWSHFSKNEGAFPSGFRRFCEKEAYWLDDYALYVIIQQQQEGKAWYDWPANYKFRDAETLHSFSTTHRLLLDKTKWLQYIFFKQWQSLKAYGNRQGIQLFGDLPFYVSYDSVDVWSHPEIFRLDKDGNMIGIAGVPPDYFNEAGQLWGMPVFHWDALKSQDYQWWIQRIRKNLEGYDLLRLDHFRAFSAYWEVPAGETTAVKGEWKTGPGAELFQALIKEFGELPFVAEDLGDIDEAVYTLRDTYHLPGMKVLQFAFGDKLPASPYAPHNYTPNYVVYSGTHDNNTTKAWFKEDATSAMKEQLQAYTGIRARKDNIHEIIIRLAFASVAKTAIVPLQDLLGLGKGARMNTPATVKGNWLWRLSPGQLSGSLAKRLKAWTELYNRTGECFP